MFYAVVYLYIYRTMPSTGDCLINGNRVHIGLPLSWGFG